MDKIALIADIHANLTALKAVFKDIENRNITKIFCLGDMVSKSVNPDIVIDLVKAKCDVILKGNCDEIFSSERALKRRFWTRMKIGDERAKFLHELPVMYEFYLSGKLVRLFHASPYSLEHIYNPVNDNKNTKYCEEILLNPLKLFQNTEFLGKKKEDNIPDIVGYAHLHSPNLFEFEDKILFNTGSVGASPKISESSYTILEGNINSKETSVFSITNVKVKYDVVEEIKYIEESDIPTKDELLLNFKK